MRAESLPVGAASRRVNFASWACCAAGLLCALLIKPVQDGFEARRGEPGPDPDLLYFSSPALVKRMALGYEGLLADLYWMRAIQYYGRRDEADKRPIRFKNLSSLLEITTTLDPDLLDAYRVGSVFLSEPDPVGAGQPWKAIDLLDRGIRMHPREWQLVRDKGFIYYWHMKDYRAAAEIWLEAAKIPGAPPWLRSLAAWSFSKGGSVEMAAMLWRNQYETATRADIKENARNHLISIEVDRELGNLRSAIAAYRQKRGSFPAHLGELGASARIEIADPSGIPFEYNPETGEVRLSPETKIRYLK